MRADLGWLAAEFAIDGEFVAAVPYGSGHINETYAATYEMHDGPAWRRFIHQRINHEVFRDPAALMANVSRVTRHLAGKLAAAGVADAGRRTLSLVPATDGADYVVDDEGRFWRTYRFIEAATTYDVVTTPAQAHAVARAFAEFQKQLADLPQPPLADTIPGFHDTPSRLAAFRVAAANDIANRAAGAAPEIDACERYAEIAGSLRTLVSEGSIPVRVAHNDTKINNVLIDEASGEGICVIDLDTVMPGLALDDFGDLVRTSVSYAKEDDRDLSKAVVDLDLFEALAHGYLKSAASFLTAAEIDNLVLGGKLMTFECGLRFLTDHLAGDTYFRVHHEGHNLDRARVQLALLDSLTAAEDELRRIVDRAAAAAG